MAYIINIKHNIANKTFPVTLHYDENNTSNADITLNITSSYTDYTLEGWTDVDATKIKVVDNDIDEGAVIYHIKNSKATITRQS